MAGCAACPTLLPLHILSPPLLNLPSVSPNSQVNASVFRRHFVHLLGCSAASSILPCSIALAAAAVLSHPRILFCTFYPKSVQKHCAFRFTVNIVTALTTEKTPKPCLLKHTIWKFLAFLFSESLSLATFKP